MREYVHRELNRKVTAIGGHYLLVKEVRLRFRGREVLYLVGHAAFNTTCCGTGGCAYGLVPGFILQWKYRYDQDGLAISQVEPIHHTDTQQQLRRLILKQEMVHEVTFL